MKTIVFLALTALLSSSFAFADDCSGLLTVKAGAAKTAKKVAFTLELGPDSAENEIVLDGVTLRGKATGTGKEIARAKNVIVELTSIHSAKNEIFWGYEAKIVKLKNGKTVSTATGLVECKAL